MCNLVDIRVGGTILCGINPESRGIHAVKKSSGIDWNGAGHVICSAGWLVVGELCTSCMVSCCKQCLHHHSGMHIRACKCGQEDGQSEEPVRH